MISALAINPGLENLINSEAQSVIDKATDLAENYRPGPYCRITESRILVVKKPAFFVDLDNPNMKYGGSFSFKKPIVSTSPRLQTQLVTTMQYDICLDSSEDEHRLVVQPTGPFEINSGKPNTNDLNIAFHMDTRLHELGYTKFHQGEKVFYRKSLKQPN